MDVSDGDSSQAGLPGGFQASLGVFFRRPGKVIHLKMRMETEETVGYVAIE
jgi:hypothetical protein